MDYAALLCLPLLLIVTRPMLITFAKCSKIQSSNTTTTFFGGGDMPSARSLKGRQTEKGAIPSKHRHRLIGAIATVSPPADGKQQDSNSIKMSSNSSFTYFFDLLSRSLEDMDRDHLIGNYAEKCEKVRKQLIEAYMAVISDYMHLISQNIHSNKSGSEFYKEVDIAELMTKNGNILDDALFAIMKHYLDMTKEGSSKKRGWFSSVDKEALTAKDQKLRLEQMIQLLIELDNHLYNIFREYVGLYKSFCMSKMFRGEQGIMNLVEQKTANKIQRDFANNVKKLIPSVIKASGEERTLVKDILHLMVKEDPSISQFVEPLKGINPDAEYTRKLVMKSKKWRVSNDIEEFSTMVSKLHSGAKSVLKRHLQDDEKQEKLLQVLAAQQQQIQAYQKQLGIKSQNSSPLSCGFSYRMPNTNVNIIGSMQRGKGNLQISCVPDESARLLGPYGFTNGVLPGNLGLSINIDI